MVSVYANPPGGQEFCGCYPMGDPTMNRNRALPCVYPLQPPDGNGNLGRGGGFGDENVNPGTGLEDPNKKVRKPYTITKSRESWTEQEHDKFLEALQLFDRDWKKIEAFVGSKTVIQIRSHAQKYFLKVQKSGVNEHVPPPRPKRKASHPYPHKAPKNVVSQAKAPFQPAAALVEPGYVIRSDSFLVPGNSVNPLSPWTNSTVPTFSISHGTKDYMVSSTATPNCSSSSSENTPRIWPTNEEKHQGKENPDKPNRAMPNFAQVYSFLGSVFDPDASDHLKRLQKMDPIDVETVLMLMKNLCANLVSPEFECHRRLLSSYGENGGKDVMSKSSGNHPSSMSSGKAVASV